ncbi:hypothetical protein ACBQ88_17145 [Citrobacter braakii]|uniref:hypothetical protein n=1 Tax=Citrobacter braakii TaxID=57706 RepID=UPI003525B031
MSNYYYGQGKIYLAPRENKSVFSWVGDVSSLNISFTHNNKINIRTHNGKLYQNKVHSISVTGSIDSVWHDFSISNLIILLGSENVNIPFSTGNVFHMPDGIKSGNIVALPHTSVFSVVIAGLKSGKDYLVDRKWGTIKFFTTPSPGVSITYDHLQNEWLPFFAHGPKEFYLRYEGVNLANESMPVLIEFYRVLIDPLATMEVISTGSNISGIDVTSLILPDFEQHSDNAFSYFGRLQFINNNSGLTYNGRANYDGKFTYRG